LGITDKSIISKNMKLNIYFLIIGMMLFFASCNTDLSVEEINDFDVTVDATTYKVGQEVRFKLSGDYVQQISFYSGEVQKDFEFREGRVIDVNGTGATMSFSSSVQLGAQLNQLSVLVSTDFNGDYSSLDKVKAAKWTDITSRFAYGTGTAFTASGVKDITDLIVAGKPIYVAFKYVTQPQQVNGLARNWYIQSFNLTSLSKLNNTIPLYLSVQGDAGFRIIDQNPVNAPALSVITNSRISLLGNRYKYPEDPLYDPKNPIYDPNNPIYDPYSTSYVPGAVPPTYVPYDPKSPYNDPYSENWAVSKPIITNSVNLGPDWSIPIKGVTNPNLTEYRYKYLEKGTYKVVFIASNNSIDNRNEVVKELTLTITE
jgi:hypothetical protein